MNLTKLKNKLSDNNEDVVEVYKLLKDGFGAKGVDILFYDKAEEVFFDKINKMKIDKRLLDDKSILGNAFITKNSYFSTDIESETRYNLSLDNPLNLTIQSQIVIPIFHNNEPQGIVRFMQLPSVFCSKDYDMLISLAPIFTKMFLKNDSTSVEDLLSDDVGDMLDVFDKLYQITELFNELSERKTNLEVGKSITICKASIDKIMNDMNTDDDEDIDTSVKEEDNVAIKIKADVLIAEDVDINSKILNAMLSDHNIIDSVQCAHDKEETIDVLDNFKMDNTHIHLLFIDHHINGMLDLEITEELRMKDTFKNKVLVISTTNDPDTLNDENLFFDYSMPKPFTKKRVAEVMEQIKAQHFSN
ncbi:MAG: hypothetical protein QM493_01885 [Sulfurovum sp.]